MMTTDDEGEGVQNALKTEDVIYGQTNFIINCYYQFFQVLKTVVLIIVINFVTPISADFFQCISY